MFSKFAGGCCGWSLVERVIRTVHQGVLAEHCSHGGFRVSTKLEIRVQEKEMDGVEDVRFGLRL
jgi:hypothetical protein